jgi:hypothetical protein
MSKTDAIVSTIKGVFDDDTLSAGKKLTEIGEVIKGETKGYAQTLNTKAAQLNLGKWGLKPAAAGIGAGAGIGGGALIASAGISQAFGLDFSDEEKAAESTKKITGWLFAAVIVALVIFVFLPKVMKTKGKGKATK